MIEIIATWDEQGQQLLAWGILATCVIVATAVMTSVRVIIRGYPPPPVKSPVAPAMRCTHADNLTGICLMRPGNCETQIECDREIENRR